ncbi:hypothetical protein AYI70_g6632 [Smittium culicis]|uniref:Uncharacterized protein n=1 Tax=Smittium culicis TaxID=133412 RepID=A0A1R1XP38_9FUNG|nr:hypothetical protein AYI70_g6632 [Smittium culicis]
MYQQLQAILRKFHVIVVCNSIEQRNKALGKQFLGKCRRERRRRLEVVVTAAIQAFRNQRKQQEHRLLHEPARAAAADQRNQQVEPAAAHELAEPAQVRPRVRRDCVDRLDVNGCARGRSQHIEKRTQSVVAAERQLRGRVVLQRSADHP